MTGVVKGGRVVQIEQNGWQTSNAAESAGQGYPPPLSFQRCCGGVSRLKTVPMETSRPVQSLPLVLCFHTGADTVKERGQLLDLLALAKIRATELH